jgi:hypothetical protein
LVKLTYKESKTRANNIDDRISVEKTNPKEIKLEVFFGCSCTDSSKEFVVQTTCALLVRNNHR